MCVCMCLYVVGGEAVTARCLGKPSVVMVVMVNRSDNFYVWGLLCGLEVV